MSSSAGIGSFKNKRDYQRQLSDAMKLLKLQIKLNKNAELASQRNVFLPPPVTVQTEVQREQTNTQQQIVQVLTSRFFTPTQAQRFVYQFLSLPTDLEEFATYMTEFLPYVKIQDKPMTPAYLNNIWKRWISRKKVEQDKAVEGAGMTTLYPTIQTEMERMGHDARVRVLNSGLRPMEMRKYLDMVEDAISQFDMHTLLRISGRM